MKNMKIGKKLLAAFMVILIGLAAISVYGILSINSITNADELLYDKNLMGVSHIADITETFYGLRTSALKTAYENFSAQGAADLQAKMDDTKTQLNGYFDEYKKTIVDQENQASLDTLKSALDQYYENITKIIAIMNSGDSTALKDQMAVTAAASTKVADQLNIMQDYNNKAGDTTMNSNRNLGSTSNFLMIIIAVAAGAIAVVFARMVTCGITGPVNKLVRAARKIAAGKLSASDLNIDLDILSKDEIGSLAKDIGGIADSIKQLISDTNQLSENIIAGKLDSRADETRFEGEYRTLVSGINRSIEGLVDNFETIPSPIMFMDKDFKINYVNRTVEELLGKSKKELLGQVCADQWHTTKCRTADCPCASAMNNNSVARCDNDCILNSKHMDLDCIGAPVKNENGEIVGCFEFISDQTVIKEASRKSEKQSKYQTNETNKLLVNLERLSVGDLTCDMQVEPADGDTQELHHLFENISLNLHSGINAIKGYINEISLVLEKMAQGDLSLEIKSEYKGDFVQLKDSINQIIWSMNEVLSEINTAADQVATGSGQVSQGNQAISQGATEQAASIEELTASLTQVAEQTHENAENSKKSNEMALDAKKAAVEGNDQMKEMLKSMEEINESSENISKIIKVIDDIAFQTNILALNAAVEAARAGMHGKGFAVVAEEVRNLAARSANAARETTELIEGSIKIVGTGTRIAQSTAEALEKIVGSVNKTVELGEGIAIASGEQAVGIAQINQGVEQMSQVVQTNSATAQEGAAASEELSGQAELLKEKISSFKLKRGQAVGQKKKNTYEEIAISQKELISNNDKY